VRDTKFVINNARTGKITGLKNLAPQQAAGTIQEMF
jgi:hypothetical protein